ncbi:hypothetical protein K2173_008619 [Erythroxylum novogranatense]|uniref:(R)-mandelonitrile lyase n=1 Tax=Erythroxylum novogranatense TaxID=1862640 RepID=A0AAV8SLK5_9ROSI|nr:hypothetical protein K2173_008619 [Erythroxylum novogranatense]
MDLVGLWKFIFLHLLVGNLRLPGFCSSQKAPPYEFVQDATTAPVFLNVDYIVIGGGTSGCPLAATLSENATVLLLERGGSPYGNPNIANIGNFVQSLADVRPDSVAQLFISEDGVFNTRPRVLGGGSAVNAGFYTHASVEDVKRAGWDQELVNKSYEWVEKKVAFEPEIKQWESAVRDGLIEVGVVPFNGYTYDHINGTKVGGTIFDKDGHRHTAADLLQYANPTNIKVLLHATVHKILFTGIGTPWLTRKPRAYGVIFKDKLGLLHKACLKFDTKNEIILSAGALGSPQLLMLNGIGPANHLLAHGIPVLADQPMVGQGMADNPLNLLFVPSPLPVEVSLVQVVGITSFGSYIETASGLSVSPILGHTLIQEYELFLNKTGQSSEVTEVAMARAIEAVQTLVNITLQGGFVAEKILGPRSSGELKLKTLNPDDNPSVSFNYFKEPEDLEICVQGMKTVIDVINSKAFSKFRYPDMSVESLVKLILDLPLNLRPRHVTAPSSLEQFCKDTVVTIWHYHGGCQVGKVVDPDYKVLGIDGLRVIDGSTFLFSPGTNPQATVMMLGRYMGRKILDSRLSTMRK